MISHGRKVIGLCFQHLVYLSSFFYLLIQREFPVRKGGGESLLRNFLGVRFEYETKTTSTYSVQNTISRSICNKVQTKNLGKGCMPVVGIKISRNSNFFFISRPVFDLIIRTALPTLIFGGILTNKCT